MLYQPVKRHRLRQLDERTARWRERATLCLSGVNPERESVRFKVRVV